MTTTTTSAPANFIGWWRSSRKAFWSMVSGGESHDDAWAALLDVLDEQRIHGGESMILVHGTHPDETATRGPRKRATT